MTLETACKILGYNPARPLAQLARMAETRLESLAADAPLRSKVACTTILRAAQAA